jgi:dethiobiotin synthetase
MVKGGILCKGKALKMNALLIAGTGIGVGKTILTTAIAAYWHRYCNPSALGLMKPIQCGTGDRELYARLFPLNQTLEEINPVHFLAPLSPPNAAAYEGRKVELDKAWMQFEKLTHQREFVLVEGLGGLGSAIARETTTADLAWDWRIPTVLVVAVNSGAIAQAVANVALANQSRVHLKGIVLNCVEPCQAHELEEWASVEMIQNLTQKPVLGCIPHLADPTDLKVLTQVAAELALEKLMPLPV